MDSAYRRTMPVSALDVEARGAFIARTYMHVFAAILAFTAIEVLFFTSGLALPIARAMMGTSWLLVLGGFMLVGWIATRVAHNATSVPAQYAALLGYVVAEAVLFLPLLVIAQLRVPGGIRSAALVTLVGFTGLTMIAFTSRKDFSFLGVILKWAGILALVTIVAGVLFGFQLGTFFSVAMVAFAGAAILYDTSNVMYRYPEDRYVGAALQLFASVAIMFWYVLRIFTSSRD